MWGLARSLGRGEWGSQEQHEKLYTPPDTPEMGRGWEMLRTVHEQLP